MERGLSEQWAAGPQRWELEMEVLAVAFDDPATTVTCRERPWCPEESGGGEFDLLAANVYLLGADGWRMTHHHASWRTSATTEPIRD